MRQVIPFPSDSEGLSKFVDAYSAYVSAVICNVSHGLLSVEDVEETAADVFVAVWRNTPRLRAGADPRPYLAQAARNMTRSRLRRRSETLPLDEELAGAADPAEEAVLRERERLLNEAVGGMKQPDREIFIRFYYFGERLADIAARLGLGLPTAKTKLRRSRLLLREKLTEGGYGREASSKEA